MKEIKNINSCRVCQSKNFIPILSLGEQYISNFIESEEHQGVKGPLELVLCDLNQGGCGLLQLKHSVSPELLWNDQYWYKSGISSTIKEDLKDIAIKIQKLIVLQKSDIVLDIGCNDGTMFNSFEKEKNLTLVGFDPSKNVAREAMKVANKVFNNFFNATDFKKEFGDKKAKIITAISMFYDLDNPNDFLKDIVSVLDKYGIFIIQQNYLVSMLEQNAFDNICYEHLEYYSMSVLKGLLSKYNLEIFDVELNDINGGSIRTYIKFKDNEKIKAFSGSKERLARILEKENTMKLDTVKPYQEFALRVKEIKSQLLNFIREEKEKGKKISIYGASTRGNTALQYFSLNNNLIDMAADKNPDKWGKKTIGTLIPIVPPETYREMKPDYLLVMTWHFFNEIKNQEKDFFDNGGKFILAMPQFKVIEKK